MPVVGPLFRHELVRIARRQRVTLWRCTYALCLVGIAAITFAVATQGFTTGISVGRTARISEGLFIGLLLLQFLMGAALIPQWTADAVAGEKEKQTLPFLLVTDLTSREVVLGKLAARLSQVLMFLLAGLPLFAALQLYGGADLSFILCVSAALAATLLSASGAAILASVSERTTKQATKRAAQIFAAFTFWPMVAHWLCRAWPKIGRFPESIGWSTYYVLDDLVDWINIGNPLFVGGELVSQFKAGRSVMNAVYPMARDYTLFHLVAAILCVGLAVRRLRPTYAAEGDGPPRPRENVPRLLRPPPRPSVGNWPVFWKALHCDARLGRTIWQFNLLRAVYVFSFFIVPGILLAIVIQSRSMVGVAETAQIFVRGLTTVILAALCMHAAGLAALAIARERQKQTLDELLLTDLSTDEILAQKWLASFWSARWVMLWVLVQWVTGLALRVLHPLAVLPLALAWVAFAALATSLGLYWSVRTTTTQRANAATGLCGFALIALPVAASMIVLLATDGRSGTGLLAMTPPGTLGLMAFSPEDWIRLTRGDEVAMSLAVGCVACVIFHAILAYVLWRAACRRFPQVIGRVSAHQS